MNIKKSRKRGPLVAFFTNTKVC